LGTGRDLNKTLTTVWPAYLIRCLDTLTHMSVAPIETSRAFRYFQPTKNNHSPFELILTHSGDDFAVMGMHFKLGLYEHQSAGALQGLIDVIRKHSNI